MYIDISTTQKCPSIPYLCLLMDALVSLKAAALYYLRFFYLLTKTYVLAISVPEAIPSICLKSWPKIKLHPHFWMGPRGSITVEFSYERGDMCYFAYLHSLQSFEILGKIILLFLLGCHISKET